MSSPVQGHEDQGVDGDQHGDDDQVLDGGAPQVTKRPDRSKGIVSGSEGHAE